jgi:hypothetical protein
MATVIPEHGYILYGDNNPDFDEGDHDHHYYDVFSVDLGKPVSKYTPIAKGIAYKKFEYGYIAFNRLEYDVTVNFGDFEVVIPSMDAVFLNEDGTSYKYNRDESKIVIIISDSDEAPNSLDSFECKSGYIKSENKCVVFKLPANATLYSKDKGIWGCHYGYRKVDDSCVKL